VTPGSPGDQAGLRAGDVVTAIGGRPVTDLYSYTDALYAHKPGDRVTVDVVREGRPLRLSVTLGARGQ
jgi:putative serine protease PepD